MFFDSASYVSSVDMVMLDADMIGQHAAVPSSVRRPDKNLKNIRLDGNSDSEAITKNSEHTHKADPQENMEYVVL